MSSNTQPGRLCGSVKKLEIDQVQSRPAKELQELSFAKVSHFYLCIGILPISLFQHTCSPWRNIIFSKLKLKICVQRHTSTAFFKAWTWDSTGQLGTSGFWRQICFRLTRHTFPNITSFLHVCEHGSFLKHNSYLLPLGILFCLMQLRRFHEPDSGFPNHFCLNRAQESIRWSRQQFKANHKGGNQQYVWNILRSLVLWGTKLGHFFVGVFCLFLRFFFRSGALFLAICYIWNKTCNLLNLN